MEIALIILAAIVALGLDYLIAREFSMIANRKGIRGSRYLWWSFFLTIVGWLMVIALPDKNPFATEKKPGCTVTGTY